MASMATLMAEAKRLGVRVHVARLDEPFMGIYDDERSSIFIQLGLTMPEVKETLAHELGHAYYRHPCSSGTNERQADRRAAWLLIDVAEYQTAERIDSNAASIAAELGLTEAVIRNFQTYWLQARGTVSASRRP